MKKVLCSACLLGINCRYDGQGKGFKNIIKTVDEFFIVPICPEQLGGLPTPRERAEIRDNKVITLSGRDVTGNFIKGAREALKIADLLGIKLAIFKQYSPSCGCGKVYDGSFSGTIIPGNGITTGLFIQNGIKVITEEELKIGQLPLLPYSDL